jgi:hypothetical protein
VQAKRLARRHPNSALWVVALKDSQFAQRSVSYHQPAVTVEAVDRTDHERADVLRLAAEAGLGESGPTM